MNVLTPEMQAFVRKHENDDIHKLALQASKYPNIDISLAMRQIEGRQVAKQKLPLWYGMEDILYPKHISLEQCSSEATAKYKSTLFSGGVAIDLTGGMGVDISFISKSFEKAICIERDKELTEIVSHNFGVLGLNNISVINTESESYLHSIDEVELIYIDPARRDDTGKKVVMIEDCSPDLIRLDSMLNRKAKSVMIKLSPMLDISQAVKALSHVTDIHVISYNNECKELLLIKNPKSASSMQLFHCVNIRKDGEMEMFTFEREDENIEIPYAVKMEEYLYEPNSSLLKAGAYRVVAKRYDLHKLHPNSHLYTSDELYPDFQGRIFRVNSVTSLNKKELKKHLVAIHQANVAVRNFPMSVDELRKRLKLKDGGNTYIFATTTFDNQKILTLCSKIS